MFSCRRTFPKSVEEIVGEDVLLLLVPTIGQGRAFIFLFFIFIPGILETVEVSKEKHWSITQASDLFFFLFFSSEILLKESVPVAMKGIALFQHYRKIGY